jgi:hypothetical protein
MPLARPTMTSNPVRIAEASRQTIPSTARPRSPVILIEGAGRDFYEAMNLSIRTILRPAIELAAIMQICSGPEAR